MRFETLAVHAGAELDPTTRALAPPLHLATTFEHMPAGELIGGFEYIRDANPTQTRLENALAALEGGATALAFGSGMAAISALLTGLPSGSHLLFPADVYHGMRVLAREYLPLQGIEATVVDTADVDAVRAALRPNTRLIWLETPSNPQIRIADIAAAVALAKSSGALVAVDNTFATPVLQNPLALGADVVMHSTTKYFGGHSDVMGGALVFARDDALVKATHERRSILGVVLAPFNAWLILRGIRSLPARMSWHCRNARALATFLEAHPRVEAVHYPGLESDAGHAIAKRQMRDFGGMLSVRIRGGRDEALAVAGKLKVFTNASSLGGCESLVEHRKSVEGPSSVSPPNLLRLSVGIEATEDLIDDFRQALA